MSQKPYLFVERLGKRFAAIGREPTPLVVFDEVTFGVEKGEFVSVIGHSGCGKSTILNIIAGLDRPSDGYVFVDGREVTQPGLSRGVIFQNHSLLPWKTALGNVSFSVRAKHPDWNSKRIEEHSMKYLALVGLTHAAERKPAQLSGGMRQRVGIARAFAIEPQILLMDEPFGALDALTRGNIQDELLSICKQTNQTVFMITHDVDEAIYLSDKILLMSNGPNARVAEQVRVNIETPRNRTMLAQNPDFYALRTHLLAFLAHGQPHDPNSRLESEQTQPASSEAETPVAHRRATARPA
jgi:nitrate/nitrite transport system ATP-binding protein